MAVLTLGDEQYDSGTYPEFTGAGAYGATWGVFNPVVRPVPGNHEYDVSSSAAGYFQYFGSSAHGPGGYYSYDLGAWHLIALNSNCTDANGCQNLEGGDGAVTAAETSWLQSDLQANRGKCTLAYWHHPLFSSADTPGSPGVKALWTSLYQAHADLVLNGHAHDYERFAPQDPNGVATTSGVTEIVAGTGGEDHATFVGTPPATSLFRDNTDFGALFLTLHPGSYDWTFKRLGGTTVDSGTAQCHYQPPAPTTDPAANVTSGSATLNGTLNPHGQTTTYHYDYGTSTSYDRKTSDQTLPQSDTTAHPAPTSLTSLTPATTYHYRLEATNAAGTTYGQDQTFTTAPAAPAVTTGAATAIASSSATLGGSADPNGRATAYHFDYGTSASYGQQSPEQNLGYSDTSSHAADAGLTGLAPATTYHYRLVAQNSVGTTYGPDATFTTTTAAPTVTTGAASEIGPTAATLTGSANPNGLATTYHFDYGTSVDYGDQSPEQSLAADTSAQTVTAGLDGLAPTTTYHYRLVAANAAGTTYGPDETLATPPQPLAYRRSPQGTWVGVHGRRGYALFGWKRSPVMALLPRDAQLAIDRGSRYTWAWRTQSARALQSPSAATRTAATIYDQSEVRVRLGFRHAFTGDLHVYAVDWDGHSRRETISVDDGSRARVADIDRDFNRGAWIDTRIAVPAGGTVSIVAARTGTKNAVLSGLFLGDAGPPPCTRRQRSPRARGHHRSASNRLHSLGTPQYGCPTRRDASLLTPWGTLRLG